MTVVWHYGSGDIKLFNTTPLANGVLAVVCDHYDVKLEDMFIATALPALPKHPKPEDAALLYRYLSEGVVIYFAKNISTKNIQLEDYLYRLRDSKTHQIDHVTDTQGNRLDVAITGGER